MVISIKTQVKLLDLLVCWISLKQGIKFKDSKPDNVHINLQLINSFLFFQIIINVKYEISKSSHSKEEMEMRLQIIHISDLHIDGKNASYEINVKKMVKSLNSIGEADECVIICSGDLALKGKRMEYKFIGGFLGALYKALENLRFKGKHIHFVCVPGNHDIDFDLLKREYNSNDVDEASNNELNEIIDDYIDSMKAFWGFAKYREWFTDNQIVSKKVIEFNKHKVGFVAVNTAPLSMLGGNPEDMGRHYLSEKHMRMIEDTTEADVNMLVMHHSIEWFTSTCKDKLRKIISKKYALLLTGHEHEPVGESRNINEKGDIICIQGNALRGYSTEGNGFCTITMDFNKDTVVGHSVIWKNNYYIPKEILKGKIKKNFKGDISISQGFLEELSFDDNKMEIDDYFVFPTLSYNSHNEKEEIEKYDIELVDDALELIYSNNKIIINGEYKSGKTTLLKQLFKKILFDGKIPLLLSASNINKKDIKKVVQYAFNEQYNNKDNEYDIFLQLPAEEKILLLDEADLLSKFSLNDLIRKNESKFGKIIVFCERVINLNIQEQVVDALVENQPLQLTIKPFLFSKRKELIANVLKNENEGKHYDIKLEVKKINEIINREIKFFNLNPEFIINFVNQYKREHRLEFSSGMNVFNVVYENSIKNKIIHNSKDIDPTLVINVLRELAYYMHFNKKTYISDSEISSLIKEYNKEYRQNVKSRLFMNATTNSKILIENGNMYRLKDKTLVAYFVAQAINQKYYQDENVEDKLKNILKNLCFSNNSDIILFLAFITNNPKFLNIIIEGAKTHFNEQEELCFDNENVKFVLDSSISVKRTLPTNEERQQREVEITKHEDIRLSDVVELINEYDYTEEDLMKLENQVLISLKYVEILSKILPVFCQNLKADQQDKFVELIYKCPNQFLCSLLRDVDNNFDEYVQGLFEAVSVQRQEKNMKEISVDSVKRMIEMITSSLIIVLYQWVTEAATTEQSISALDAFDFNINSNYQLMNLMIQSKYGDIAQFSKRAKELDKNLDRKLEKSIIFYTVRDYFLKNDIETYGEAQSLMDHFFENQSKQRLKMEMAKKKLTDNRT